MEFVHLMIQVNCKTLQKEINDFLRDNPKFYLFDIKMVIDNKSRISDDDIIYLAILKQRP